MDDCIFCKIVNKQEEAPIVFENENFVVIPSKYPAAETHLLVLTKKHLKSVKHVEKSDESLIGEMIIIGADVARQQNLEDYKLLFNTGKYSQIPHIHLHILAGNLESIPQNT